jgi:hypothetical protein
MKKTLKSILTMVCAAALVVFAAPTNALAAPAANTAFLSYADAAWTYQYWGDPVENGVIANDVTVSGVGQYTVSLDFTQTADGKATGLAFIAPQIQDGELNFPGYFMQVDSVQVNGEEVSFTKGYTSSDDKKTTRTNLYNTWVAELPEDAHTLDGSLDGASAVVIDPAAFDEVETVSVTFTYYDADGNGAAEDTATDTAATDDAATTTTDVPKTGVIGLGIVYGLGALATGAVVLKRKEK